MTAISMNDSFMLFFASYWSLCHEYFQLVTFISSQMTGCSGKNKHCSELLHFVAGVQKKFQLSKTWFKLLKMTLQGSERHLTLEVLQIWPGRIFLILSRSVRAPANMTRSKDYKNWSTKHLVHTRLPDHAGGNTELDGLTWYKVAASVQFLSSTISSLLIVSLCLLQVRQMVLLWLFV